MTATRSAGNGNGKVTLALVVDRLDRLTRAVEEHDQRDRLDHDRLWEHVSRDHDRLLTLEPHVSTLKADVADLRQGLAHQVRESRIVGGIANLIAGIAAALSGGRPGNP